MNKNKIINIILLLITIMSLSATAYFALFTNHDDSNFKSSSSVSVKLIENGKAVKGKYIEKSKKQILSELQKAQITVTDKVSSFVLFENGSKGSVGSWVVQNIPSNNVIMQCEVFVGDKLYAKSVPIYPNEHIENIELLDSLTVGSYDAVAYINYFKLNSKEYISKAGYKIKLIVQ